MSASPLPPLLYVPDAITKEDEAAFLAHMYANDDDEQGSTSSLWTNLKFRRLMQLGGAQEHPEDARMTKRPLPDWALSLKAKSTAAHRHLEQVFSVSDKDHTKEINHVLINEYKRPNGIMPHEDGPLYHPVVAIFSLESTVPLTFERKKKKTLTVAVPSSPTPLPIEVQTTPTANAGDGLYDDEPDAGIEALLSEPPPPSAEVAEESSSNKPAEHLLPDRLTVLLEPRSLVVFSGELYHDYLHSVPCGVGIDTIPWEEIANRGQLSTAALSKVSLMNDDEEIESPKEEDKGDREDRKRRMILVNERSERRISVTYRHVPSLCFSE